MKSVYPNTKHHFVENKSRLLSVDVSKTVRWNTNSVDTDQTPPFVVTNLDLHWLLGQVCPNT